MSKGHSFLLGFAALSVGLFAMSGSQAAGLPADAFTALVSADIKYIQDTLAEETAGKHKSSIKTTAILIAYLAQSQMDQKGADKKQLATLRDEALELAGAIAKKDFDAAKKIASGLKVDIKANPSAKLDAPKWASVHSFDLSELMTPFRLEKVFGRNFEKSIRDNAKKLSPEAANLANRTIVIAEFTTMFAPTVAEGKKTPAAWNKHSKEMKDAAIEASTALTGPKKDEKKAMAAFKKLDATCTRCHNDFRDD